MQAIIAYRNADGTFKPAQPLPGCEQELGDHTELDGLAKVIARQIHKEREAARRAEENK